MRAPLLRLLRELVADAGTGGNVIAVRHRVQPVYCILSEPTVEAVGRAVEIAA